MTNGKLRLILSVVGFEAIVEMEGDSNEYCLSGSTPSVPLPARSSSTS